jgi:hypothetical protein
MVLAAFRRSHRQADGLQVAHFTDEDHVRVLAQRRTQGVVERQRMRTDFALVDQRLFRFVHEFDRVFHGQDVAHLVLVDVVHHRRQRGGFTGAGRTGHQHHAAREFGDVLEDRRAF